MQLFVLNQPVTTYENQIMALMFYQIALQVMIKGKLTKCSAIMKVKAVKLLVQMTCNLIFGKFIYRQTMVVEVCCGQNKLLRL